MLCVFLIILDGGECDAGFFCSIGWGYHLVGIKARIISLKFKDINIMTNSRLNRLRDAIKVELILNFGLFSFYMFSLLVSLYLVGFPVNQFVRVFVGVCTIVYSLLFVAVVVKSKYILTWISDVLERRRALREGRTVLKKTVGDA